ncbi:F0F1 ATP synthase subunit B [Aidingimonas halophila]|uniref:ATP synthase subunit b n=1 Tax=Aidingimonas halophila TaxID=574349 RepID=A0A1H2XJR1_9GAMM|nr:F0F1 ATP synthase subunit B [Aidingimonas halophila]GHC28855.1 ATP synthase subunit b [Aidingimonas halophila]SDW92986.1 F-type H+-transporting ATPase subunit b [Aidingimonas halophila]
MNINMTLIGQSIAFAIFVWFCIKYVWPPISQALHERQKKIAEGLDAASRATRDLELAQERADQTLRESKEQASEILEQANKRANQMIEEAREQARAESDRIVAGARAEVEQEVNRAKEELRTQVATLAVTGAERILESSIDEQAHRKMLDKLAAEL